MNNAARGFDLIPLPLRTPVSALANSSRFQSALTFSPVSELAMSFGDLVTDGFGDTPKRRLSLSSTTEGTPCCVNNKPSRPNSLSLHQQISVDDGCCMDSPSPLDSNPYFKKRSFDIRKEEESALELKSSAFRRFKSLPKPFADLDNSPIKSESLLSSPPSSPSFHSHLSRDGATSSLFSPSSDNSGDHRSPSKLRSPCHKNFSLHEDEESSQDSGVGLDKVQSPFAKPSARAPRRSRVLSDRTNSPGHNSPKMRRSSTPDFSQHFKTELTKYNESPAKLRQSSLTCSPENEDGDDGFLELLEDDDANIPKGLEGLMKNPLLPTGSSVKSDRSEHSFLMLGSDFTPGLRTDNQENLKPRKSNLRRGLFRSPSTPAIMGCKANSPIFSLPSKKNKRCDDDDTPTDHKRRRSVVDNATPEKVDRAVFHRSNSEALIKSALDTCDSTMDMIGDFSKPYCLPTIPGSKSDLKCISPQTMSDLMNGVYDHVVEKYVIIDSRFPYEFEGGHIQNAHNIWEKSDMVEFQQKAEHRAASSVPSKRKIVIFHCEFSSERGPKMSRFLRKIDRAANKECYPSLDYPELYLLEGGYKAFYHSHKGLHCEPESYKPMSHEDHGEELRFFRAKSKSWAGEKAPKGSRVALRQLKL